MSGGSPRRGGENKLKKTLSFRKTMSGGSPKRGGENKLRKTLSFRKSRKPVDLSETKEALKQAIQASAILRDPSLLFVDFYDPDEIKVGRLIRGGVFYNVHELERLQDRDVSISEISFSEFDEEDNRNKNHAIDKLSGTQYVIRKISSTHAKSKGNVNQAMLSLVLEAKYLARSCHPNIIRMKGLPSGEEDVLDSGNPKGFFAIRERFVETLNDRLKRWKSLKEAKKSKSSHHLSGTDGAIEACSFSGESFNKKLGYAKDIARALEYLHKRGIVVLNLSPDTIGFLKDGTIQISDLTCCQEKNPEPDGDGNNPKPMNFLTFDKPSPDRKDSTKNHVATAKSDFLAMVASDAGVPRYVAPEAITDRIYTVKADTYSWGLTLFELLSLHKPYANYKPGEHLIKVCMEGQRPNLASHMFPSEIKSMLSLSWRKSYSKRPLMSALIEAIPMLVKLRASVVTSPQA